MLTYDLSHSLFEIGAIKTGQFTLKSGVQSPIYVDLRNLISYPEILDQVTDELVKVVQHLEFDCICGVPYTGIPIATLLSHKLKKPMLLRRKELKAHGTRRIIEGVFQEGQKCLIVEDIVTSGLSILETIKALEDVRIEVTDAVCLIDREQGGKTHLKKQGFNLHSLTTLLKVLDQLEHASLIDKEKSHSIKSFIRKHPFQEP